MCGVAPSPTNVVLGFSGGAAKNASTATDGFAVEALLSNEAGNGSSSMYVHQNITWPAQTARQGPAFGRNAG
jgi:hypothetical protein